MKENTKRELEEYISQLLSMAAWRKSRRSTNIQGKAIAVAGPSVGGLTVPSTGTGARASVRISSEDRQKADINAQCYPTAIARAPAPEFELNRQFSGIVDNFTQEMPFNNLLGVNVPKDHSAAIEKMKSAIKEIQEPVHEDRIKDFVKGDQFKTWLTSKSSDALLVNNNSVNLSPMAEGVSILTEFTLLLHEKLSLLPKNEKASTLFYLCADFPESTETMTTMQRMLQYLTSEQYVNDREHWDEQESVRQYIRILYSIRENDPRNKANETNFLIDSLIHLLDTTQQAQVIYILIDGSDLVEMDERKGNKSDFWWFLECLYSLIDDHRKPKKTKKPDEPTPIIKLFITYHGTCQRETGSYWEDYVVNLP
ncbi:hypothetical protein TCE0_022r06434 [Talaromyces pinophilus]|uniref:Uncharacterized protein n=1 Tax=Talaromyces pinophilus TaxID=128442 RepID=A0A6V8H770_TALPI|nr:hypothetical protein TCE0_022r06434 [Talaromyces pinophilus]